MKRPDPSRPIRLALLGCGSAAGMHGKTLGHFGDRVACWYASRDPARAANFAARHGGSGSFGSYAEAIASEAIDAVMVLTPPHTHLELARAALEAGKHLIVEKPPFFSTADFDRVATLARERDLQFMVAENYFYKPSRLALKSLLEERVIGDPLLIHLCAVKRQTTGDWRDDPRLAGGGALFEGGIHWINFLANLGLPIRDIRGARPEPRGGAEKSALVTFTTDGGPVGTLAYSWEVPSLLKGLRISRIFGRDGSITFETNGLFIFVRGRRIRFRVPGLRDLTGYRAMFDDFLTALRRGSPPAFTPELARRDLELLERIEASWR